MSFCLLLIKGYQLFVSPFLGKNCRFYPSCSAYTYKSLQKFGFLVGLYLGVKRILRCHPWGKGGYDPVPNKVKSYKLCCKHKSKVKGI